MKIKTESISVDQDMLSVGNTYLCSVPPRQQVQRRRLL
jgi:hypothetical protein